MDGGREGGAERGREEGREREREKGGGGGMIRRKKSEGRERWNTHNKHAHTHTHTAPRPPCQLPSDYAVSVSAWRRQRPFSYPHTFCDRDPAHITPTSKGLSGEIKSAEAKRTK